MILRGSPIDDSSTGLYRTWSASKLIAALASGGVVSGGGTNLYGLVSGGGVVNTSGLSFAVAAASYYIDSTLRTSAEQTITLAAADGSNPRIDVLYLDDAGLLGKITGTPAATPSPPSVDPGTQLYLTFVLVPASAVTFTGITTTDIYLEATEWTPTVSGSGFTAASTNNPYAGTKDIELTNVTAGSYVKLVAGAPISFDGEGNLVFRIRSKAAWNSKRSLQIQWFLAGVAKGSPVTLRSGAYGFDSTQTASYQLAVIPKSAFLVPSGATVDEVRFTDAGGAIGGYLDNIQLQNVGATVTPPGAPDGLTQAEADQRYLQLVNYHPAFIALSDAPTSYAGAGGKQVQVNQAANALVFVSPGSDAMFFGWGTDGDLVVNSGTTVINADKYYRNLTISGTGKLDVRNCRIFVSGTLDISAAPADAITASGGAASGTSGGIAQSNSTRTCGAGASGANGAAGTTGVGAQGNSAVAATGVAPLGGPSGASGAGGTSGTNAGGALRAGISNTIQFDVQQLAVDMYIYLNTNNGQNFIAGGCSGAGGSAGGGDGVSFGGNGGGPGAGGGVILVACRVLKRSASTAVGAISAKGGAAAAGTVGSGGTNRGGGGGGSGGGGGYIRLIVGSLDPTGAAGTNIVDVSGGQGGAGANGTGASGIGGDGGNAGGGGRIDYYNLAAGTFTNVPISAAVAGNAHSGATGGAVKAAVTNALTI